MFTSAARSTAEVRPYTRRKGDRGRKQSLVRTRALRRVRRHAVPECAAIPWLVPANATPPLRSPQELVLLHQEDALKLALSMVRKWRIRIEREELQSLTSLALCEAAQAFDPARGTKFSTFLFYFVKGRLIRSISERVKDSRVLTSLEGPSNTAAGDMRRDCLNATSAHTSVDPVVEDTIYKQQLFQACERYFQSLTPVKRTVMQQTFVEGRNLASVSDTLGYSRVHISRIRTQTIANLRDHLATTGQI